MAKINERTICENLRGCMTVEDLIAQLSNMDPEAYVVFASDYGDYSHTTQLTAVESAERFDNDNEQIYGTAYSNSGLAVQELDYNEDGEIANDEQDGLSIVILR